MGVVHTDARQTCRRWIMNEIRCVRVVFYSQAKRGTTAYTLLPQSFMNSSTTGPGGSSFNSARVGIWNQEGVLTTRALRKRAQAKCDL